MKIGIICFSGTGNTERVAREYQRRFIEAGHEVCWDNLEESGGIDTQDLGLLVIAYPVHAFNAPEPVLAMARELHSVRPLPVAVLKTSGEPLRLNNSSSDKLIRILKRRNMKVVGEYWYLMPYNIIFRHSDGMAWRMWRTALDRIPHDARWLLSGGEHHLRPFPMGRLLTFLFRIEHWGARLNGRLFCASSSCVHCGKCVSACPRHNIRDENGRMVFSGNCVLCMRCVMNCPAKAITIGFLKGWEVYGTYSFTKAEYDNSLKYCRRAYSRYFSGRI